MRLKEPVFIIEGIGMKKKQVDGVWYYDSTKKGARIRIPRRAKGYLSFTFPNGSIYNAEFNNTSEKTFYLQEEIPNQSLCVFPGERILIRLHDYESYYPFSKERRKLSLNSAHAWYLWFPSGDIIDRETKISVQRIDKTAIAIEAFCDVVEVPTHNAREISLNLPFVVSDDCFAYGFCKKNGEIYPIDRICKKVNGELREIQSILL